MIRFERSGMNNLTGNRRKLYGSIGVHPYLRADFWNNPLNHFWENDMYSEESKEYFRDTVRKLNEAKLNIRG